MRNRIRIRSVTPWLPLITVGLVDTLEAAGAIPNVPLPFHLLLAGVAASITISTLVHRQLRDAAERLPIVEAMMRGRELAAAELRLAAEGGPDLCHAVGETTTFGLPALRLVGEAGTVYASNAAKDSEGRPVSHRRGLSPRQLHRVPRP